MLILLLAEPVSAIPLHGAQIEPPHSAINPLRLAVTASQVPVRVIRMPPASRDCVENRSIRPGAQDAKVPLETHWYNDSCLDLPVGR